MTENRTYIKKRRVPRRAFNRNIGILVSGKYFVTTSFELGEGGMLITSPVPLAQDQKIVISFRVPGMVHVVARGTVRYHKKANDQYPEAYGVQFDKIDFDAKRKIRNYVAMKSVSEDLIGVS